MSNSVAVVTTILIFLNWTRYLLMWNGFLNLADRVCYYVKSTCATCGSDICLWECGSMGESASCCIEISLLMFGELHWATWLLTLPYISIAPWVFSPLHSAPTYLPLYISTVLTYPSHIHARYFRCLMRSLKVKIVEIIVKTSLLDDLFSCSVRVRFTDVRWTNEWHDMTFNLHVTIIV